MKDILTRLFNRNFIKPCKRPSLLAMSIVGFTNESWMNQIQRQGTIEKYLANK
jgi:hypothetical protein